MINKNVSKWFSFVFVLEKETDVLTALPVITNKKNNDNNNNKKIQ